jgi:hypothetical protein
MMMLTENSSPARGGGPRGASRGVEGAHDVRAFSPAALWSRAPSTMLRMVPLPVPGRIWA